MLLRLTTEIRSFLRLLGLTKHLANLQDRWNLFLGKTKYEFNFDKTLCQLIKKNDIVWDIGANVGLYTIKFSELVEPLGVVYSFEPAPACFHTLQQNCLNKKNIRLLNVALGKTSGVLSMNIATDPLGVSHTLVNSAPNTYSQKTNVWVTTGDEIIKTMQSPMPNVIKIDVEGFEEEVLLGMQLCLQNKSCRAIFCEIHFSILHAKGERFAPTRIQDMLKNSGFTVKWIDRSHLGAYRSCVRNP